MSDARQPNHTLRTVTPAPEPTKISRRGFLAGVGAAVLLHGCFDSIILCRDDIDAPNGGCSVSQATGMKPGDSLQAGNYKLVYTGVSGDYAVFNINDLKGKTLDTMEVPAGKTRAVAPHNECSGYVLSVTSVNADGTADAEVKTSC